MGIPEHLIALLRDLYDNQQATVRTEVGECDKFDIGKGVRQGCILSPYIFNLYSEIILRSLDGRSGVRIGGENVNNLRYTDDTTL